MAATAGKNASWTADNITVLIANWTLDYAVDMLEITSFSDAGVEKNLPGIKRWSGTLSGPLDATNTADVGDVLTTVLFEVVDAGVKWSGASAFIERITDTVDTQGVNMRAYDIKGNGILTPVS